MCKVKDIRANAQVSNPEKRSTALLQHTVENSLSIYPKLTVQVVSLAQRNYGKF